MSTATQTTGRPISALAEWLRMAHSLLDGKTHASPQAAEVARYGDWSTTESNDETNRPPVGLLIR